MKDVKIKTDYITLGQLLKYLSYVGSGGEAKIFLEVKRILVNHEPENRRGKKLYPSDVVKIEEDEFLIKSNEDK
jgi:S4 domain protein YaaA